VLEPAFQLLVVVVMVVVVVMFLSPILHTIFSPVMDRLVS
jgi:hypothetical protein